MRALAVLLCGLGLGGALLGCATPAGADVFGPISLVSAGHLPGAVVVEQATDAKDTVISADGRYLAFDGSFGGKTGVFRRDLQTGEIAVVAEGDAMLPSISEEGRYVSFTTTARLDEENDTNAAPDVYVRDMDDPSSEPCGPEWEQKAEACAFTLASAESGSSTGLRYEYPSTLAAGEKAFKEKNAGSLASGRSALSADGREVVFVTTEISDLAGPGTPALEVAVRYLDSKRTELVSTLYRNGEQTTEPVPESSVDGLGAVYLGGLIASTTFPPTGYAGASISADGSTVAWMGTQIGEQAPVLAKDLASQPEYIEPLWRRIGEGTSSATRRITGGSDPTNPQCAQSGETELPQHPTLADPCQGPFETTGGLEASGFGVWTGGSEYDYVPQLSANGMTVAFIATARYIAGGEEFSSGGFSDDLYVVNMASGLTRVQALRRLTELASGNTEAAYTAPIVDLGVSPDGSQVAFTTARTVFPLGSPSLVSPPSASAGVVELFDVDLANDTLTRVTQGYEGQPAAAPLGERLTGSPSFSGDGELLAFASTDDNLIYGDGNDASDAFLVPRLSFPATPAPQAISSAPANPALIPVGKLSATAVSRSDGSVLLYVVVPSAGTLRAQARGAVPVRSAAASRACKRRRKRCRAAKTVATRTVAGAADAPAAGGLTELALTLPKTSASLAERSGGLYSTVTLSFAAAGQAVLHASIHVTFVRKPRLRKRTPAKHNRSRRR